MSQIMTAIRNAELTDVLTILQEQRARRLDVVVTPKMISAAGGNIAVAAADATQLITDEGITSAAGSYRPTVVGDEGLGQLLGIDGGYLKKLRRIGRPDIWDANVNGMLHGTCDPDQGLWEAIDGPSEPPYPPYDGSILLRLLKGDEQFEGVLRAALSPRYKIIDNLDVLLAVMQGIQQAGVDAQPDVCDLSDRRMYVRFVVPELAAFAPKLLEGYRSPFDGPGAIKRAGDEDEGGPVDRPGMRLRVDSRWRDWTVPQALQAAAREGQGYEPGQEPVVFAGLIVSNSDTGDGARTIAPQIRIRACKNGLTLVAAADRKVHLGSKQDDGVVAWSAETMERELQLITSQAADAVRTFLDKDWFLGQIAEIEKLAGVPVDQPEQVIRDVTKAAGFTKAEQAGILAHFLRGGAYTAGGVANAVSSFSQTVDSPDRQAELDAKAVDVMAHAARLAA